MTLKRVLSLLIALSMVLSVGIVSLAQDAETETAVKYDTVAYSRALNLMESVVGESVFGSDPTKMLTRAEFVDGIAKIFKVDDVDGSSIYLDVADDHKSIGAINAAYNRGWISKAENFNPDAQITYAQALKIVLVATDYGMFADVKGGFPGGYLEVAEIIDLFDNIDVYNTATVSVADATILYYNLMLAPVFKITAVGEAMPFELTKETQLENMFDAYKIEGIVTATEHNSILVNAPFKKDNGQIEIDGISYEFEDSDVSLLGKNVIAYCSNEGTKLKKLYCVIPERNEEITFLAKDYEGIIDGTIRYYEDEKLRDEDLETAYSIIYNGRRVVKLEDYMLDDVGATIRILDNNYDGIYDYVFVDSYKYGIITGVDYVEGYIAFKTPDELIDLTADDEHACYFRDASGNKIELYELTTGVAVAIKASADSRLYDLTVLPETASGIITSIDDGENTMAIGEISYEMASDFKEKYIDAKILAAGDNVTVAIGIHGEAAYLISSSSEAVYGILHNIDRDKEGLNKSARVKILTTNCEFNVFEIAEKVVIDGAAKKLSRDDAYTYIEKMLTAAKEDTTNPALVVKYALNADNQLKMIDFSTDDTSNFGKTIDPQNSLTKYIDKSETVTYRNGGFASKVMLKTATIIFVSEDVAEREDEANYAAGNYTMFHSNVTDGYKIDAYDIDNTGNAQFVIVYLSGDVDKRIARYTDSYMIEKVTQVSVDGEDYLKLYCWSKNKYQNILMPTDVAVEKSSGSTTLVPGDIVRLNIKDNKVQKVYVDYDYSTGTHVKDANNGADFGNEAAQHPLAFVWGKVYNIGSGTVVISNEDDGQGNISFAFDDLRPYSINNVIACFDSETKTIRTIKADSIHSYIGHGQGADTIILRTNYNSPSCAFIIR